MVLVPDPERRWRVDLSQARWKDSDEPLMEGCPCPACALGLTRGYLRYLAHARELTGMRLFTLHNLAFVERVMRRLREAIGAGTLAAEAAARSRAGADRAVARRDSPCGSLGPRLRRRVRHARRASCRRGAAGDATAATLFPSVMPYTPRASRASAAAATSCCPGPAA